MLQRYKLAPMLVLVLFAALLAIFFASRFNNLENTDNQTSSNKKYKIGISYMTLNNTFFLDLSKSLKSVTDKNGDILIETDSQLDVNKQISDIEDMVSQKVDLILVCPVDSKGVKPALLTCKRAGIPVIACSIPVEDSELVASTIATDNVMAGQLAGEACVKLMKENAKIAIIDWDVVGCVVERVNSFIKAIKPYGNMQVVVRQNANASTESALPLMENILQSNPEINAVFCINDPSALGVLAACEAARRTDIKIFSVDGSQAAIELIKSGKIVGSSAQFPVKIGQLAMDTAYKLLSSQPFEKKIPVKSEWIDYSNVDKYTTIYTK